MPKNKQISNEFESELEIDIEEYLSKNDLISHVLNFIYQGNCAATELKIFLNKHYFNIDYDNLKTWIQICEEERYDDLISVFKEILLLVNVNSQRKIKSMFQDILDSLNRTFEYHIYSDSNSVGLRTVSDSQYRSVQNRKYDKIQKLVVKNPDVLLIKSEDNRYLISYLYEYKGLELIEWILYDSNIDKDIIEKTINDNFKLIINLASTNEKIAFKIQPILIEIDAFKEAAHILLHKLEFKHIPVIDAVIKIMNYLPNHGLDARKIIDKIIIKNSHSNWIERIQNSWGTQKNF